MSITHKDLMALRRAQLAEKAKLEATTTRLQQQQQQNQLHADVTQRPTMQHPRQPAPGQPQPTPPAARPGGPLSPQRAGRTLTGTMGTGTMGAGTVGLGGTARSLGATGRSTVAPHRGGIVPPAGVAATSVAPKVFAPFKTPQGHVPRGEQERRAREAYDSEALEQLLAAEGIDYYRDGVGGAVDESLSPVQRASQYHRLLPLEAFDDFAEDEFTPSDWMAKGVDPATGAQLGLPCLAVRVDQKKRGRWDAAKVFEWNTEEHRLLVEWDEDKQRTWLPRVYICLSAENPELFTARVVGAHQRRKEAETILRFNLCVDSMPVDDTQTLDADCVERVRDLAITTATLLNNEDALDVQRVVTDVNSDFARTLNKILFQTTAQDPAMAHMFSHTPLPASVKDAMTTKAPRFGRVQVAGTEEFADVIETFKANSYLDRQEEVVLATHRVRDECDRQLLQCIFSLPPYIDSSRPHLLQDFDETQNVSIVDCVQKLRQQWCGNIKEHIKDSLRDTTARDEVNLAVSSKDEYFGTKTQRFMHTIKMMMQDTLYHLVTASLEGYVRFIEDASNFTVSITDMATVAAAGSARELLPRKMGHDLRALPPPDSKLDLPPLFRVSLRDAAELTGRPARAKKADEKPADDKKDAAKKDTDAPNADAKPAEEAKKERGVAYSTAPRDFVATVIATFDRAVLAHQEVPQIEHQVLEFMYAPQTPMIPSAGLQHPLVCQWRDRLRAAMTAAVEPLTQYLDAYDEFADLLAIDVAEAAKGYEQSSMKLRELEREVQRHLDRQQRVLAAIPDSVNLGAFRVDCADFRRRLADKCAQLAQKVLDAMAKQARKKAEDVEEKFSAIRSVLIRPIECPEDCVKIRDFIKTIPEQAFDIQVIINEMAEVFDSLDGFKFPLSDDDFMKKWRAIGWPARLDDDIVRTNQHLEQQRRVLIDAMEKNQDNFVRDIEKTQRVVAGFYKRTDIKKVSETAAEVKSILADIQRCKEQAATFSTHEALFEKAERTDYSILTQIAKDFEPYSTLWTTADDWLTWHNAWNSDPFDTIDAEAMETNVLGAGKNMIKVLKDPKFKDKAPILKIAEDIKAQIDEFKPVVPTVKYLRQQGMKDRHWNELSRELGFEVRPGVTLLTLQDVYSLDLQVHESEIQKISEVAGREYSIEQSLEKMKHDWGPMKLGVKAYKKTGCFILPKDTVDDTQEMLDDHTLNTQALSFSPFKKHFEKEIEEWERELKLVQAILDEWKTCQKAWMYLEPIFQSDDIVRQLPTEAKRFSQVNKNWRFLTVRANEVQDTHAYATQTEKCLELFEENNALLDKIQKGLNQYLENKRSAFARFYFLSDDELLTILSEAKDPQKIQPHFRKLFENIMSIDMRAPDNEMFGMTSQMDEYVPFKETVFPRKNVENWLSEIEAMMKRSLRHQLDVGMKDVIAKGRKEFILNACGQIAIAISQVYWTADCERHLNDHGTLQGYVQTANDNLMMLVETVRQPLTNLQRMNLGGLITVEVHARDIVEKLSAEKVTSVLAFEWVSQLRSYWQDDDCYLRQVEAQFKYGCEYLGNTTRLVITPLTDRIYLTLTGAMHMFLGSAPAGPAGTGKTETVKDLAKAVSKQCVVFNCQEGMTFASMGKFFKGLANAGAWACFDEFNRIDVEVLSVVAQQVSTLQEAARTKQYRIPFEGTEIVVDPTYSVFITMNPGYAGRTELPDNLKVLFRPVACMVPDYAMIGEIRLFSYGYADSRKLAQKMVATFRLSSEQLSSQDHYDFGMRAVNTVISAAGLMKRENPDQREDILLLRALRDSNAPKFLKEDLLLFSGIISDLFPKIEVPQPDYGNFMTVLREKAIEAHLQPTDLFLKKCIELYEMTVLRHGQMSVGPTMGGKSSATKVLAAAMKKLKTELHEDRFAEVMTFCLNPKSITMAQLYGGFDDATGEWRDGQIGELFRIAAADKTEAKKWIIFDGPVDALWIESMNTVLDENKKLCLISGEIIAMSQYMNIWFEVEDLAVASPATVSRAGMIYLEPTTCIGVENFVRSWQMYRLPETMAPYRETLQTLGEAVFPNLLHFVATHCTEYQKSVWPNLVTSCFNIFDAFLEPFTPTRTFDPPPEQLELLQDIYLHLFIFAVVWSIGGTTDAASRKKFDKYFKEELQRAGVTVPLPEDDTLYEWQFSPEDRRWVRWTERAPNFDAAVSAESYGGLIVPTADVMRYQWLMRHLLTKDRHVLAVGPTGTGKTLLINELLMKGMPAECTPIFFTFSARTSSNQTQDLIFSKFEVRRRASPQIWGAPVGKKFMVFIDDVNMPLREQYGAQPPVELLRQWMDYHGWYDRKTREFFNVVDTVYVGAMGPPGGGRNPVSNRFLRHFNFISFPDIDDENATTIFGTMLSKFLGSQAFGEDVRSLSGAVVQATVEVYNTIADQLRPRPSRPHYLFNLRDVANVIAGLLNAEVKLVQSSTALLSLWMHESARTFRDRLIDDDDRAWFDELMAKQLHKHWRLKPHDVVHSERLLYADFLNPQADYKQYTEVTELPKLMRTCEHYLEEYNSNSMRKMPLVMFLDAVGHVARIARILKKPGGHALLLGVGGSGRQSLSRLAASICELDTRQVEITKGYSMNAWRDDIRSVLKVAAYKNQHLAFLITDTQIVHEGMLEDVNNLLNSGEVPNLFVGPDIDELLQNMKPMCVAEGIPLDKVNIFARFVRACRSNMHIIVCMSPIGEPFRNRLRMFPALVSCCTIDWFSAWPTEALRSVAKEFFDGGADEDPLFEDEATTDHCVDMCVYMHQTVEHMSATFLQETKRHNYVTPTSYLDLLQTFKKLLMSEAKKSATQKNRLLKGLETLRETEVQVAELQSNLERDQPLLLQRKEQIATMVEEIAVETEAAEVTRQGAVADEKEAQEKTDQCTVMFQESEEMLAQAKPLLDEALEALNLLKPKDFNEVNTYKVFTAGVTMTLEGVCQLLSVKPIMKAPNPQFPDRKEPDYTQPAKELLSKPNVLMDKLLNYDRENIPDRIIKQIGPLVKSDEFTPPKISTASRACGAMCSWVHAMYKYHFVAKDVQPLRDALAVAKRDLAIVTEKLDAAKEKLRIVEEKLAGLNQNKEQAEAEMAELEAKVKNTELKLTRASMLIEGLAGEKKNWLNTVQSLTEREKYLVGDVLCAAGQVSYVGCFTSKYRGLLLDQWTTHLSKIGVLHSEQVSVFHTLSDPIQTRQWAVHGLPSDGLSIENAIIMTNARRWPLMIDPQQQANKWLRHTYGEQLEIVKPTNKDMIKRIEHCIRGGRPVLLENVSDELDPSLDPLLNQQTFMQGGQLMIRISENPVPWSHDFKFFMTTKHTNPHYIPEVMVKVTLLNFFITPSGLEDQLLGVLVGVERRELETQKNALVQQNAAMRSEAADIQSTILRKLDEVTGDILEDEDLIKYLDQSKVKTLEIQEKVAEAEQTEREIDETREGYRPVAYHGSILYFCCADLANVDPMYQYSLQWFVQLFETGIEGAERSDVLDERLEHLKQYFTYSFYQNISRSVFEKHKLMFAFVLCIRILQGSDKVDPAEWHFLIAGPSEQLEPATPNPNADWVTEVTWRDLAYLDARLPAFEGLCLHIARNEQHYRKLFMSATAHEDAMAAEWAGRLTPMQRMLFVRCLRPDKLMSAVQHFIEHAMDERFIKPPPFDLATSFKDSTPTTPLIFVLSPGADPFEEWKKFAETMRMGKRLADISLGQGQGPRAERLMREGMETGMWVLLQNCHLATSWMPTLERLTEGMGQGINPAFRLWLTSMPNPHFPVSILQNGVKMTNEPPKGMRANVTRSLMSYPNDSLERCSQPGPFKKLVFSLCFFHALIQERRKFGPLGWNIPYEYTSGDLSCCISQTRMFLDKYEEVPFRVIKELSGQIHYGGRVTDDWDRRTLTTILDGFIGPELMDDTYAFSPSGDYVSVAPESQADYLRYVGSWPLNQHPEVFGLHENADITCARNETFDTLATILTLQGAGVGGGGTAEKSPDETVTEMANTILQRVRAEFDIKSFQHRYPTKYEDSMNTVVVQEVIRFNRLLRVLRTSLQNLVLAIKGMVVMSKELEAVYKALLTNLVPDTWAEAAYPSLKPLASWVSDLVERLKMLERWYDGGHPKAFWISGFYFPQAFLTGILQNYARQQQISIDTISYGFEWVDREGEAVTQAPPSGCYIYGMHIEGARVDRRTLALAESRPKVLFETTPLVWLIPTINREAPAGVYRCPLYKTLKRAGTLSTTGHSTNYVLTVEIPTAEDPAHWIKRGVAMVCALNY